MDARGVQFAIKWVSIFLHVILIISSFSFSTILLCVSFSHSAAPSGSPTQGNRGVDYLVPLYIPAGHHGFPRDCALTELEIPERETGRPSIIKRPIDSRPGL